jgi:hypothetical protein
LVIRDSSLCTTKMDGVMNEPSAGSAAKQAEPCCEMKRCLEAGDLIAKYYFRMS